LEDQEIKTAEEAIESSLEGDEQEQEAENVVLITNHEEMVSFWQWLGRQEVN
jgi:hypothetical protein